MIEQKALNIQRYFLHGDALIRFIREEMGLPPMEKCKDYRDYVIAGRFRRLKSEGLKRLFKNYFNIPSQNENNEW